MREAAQRKLDAERKSCSQVQLVLGHIAAPRSIPPRGVSQGASTDLQLVSAGVSATGTFLDVLGRFARRRGGCRARLHLGSALPAGEPLFSRPQDTSLSEEGFRLLVRQQHYICIRSIQLASRQFAKSSLLVSRASASRLESQLDVLSVFHSPPDLSLSGSFGCRELGRPQLGTHHDREGFRSMNLTLRVTVS